MYFTKKIQQRNYDHSVSKERASGTYIEGVSNILSIKSSGAEKSFQEHIANNEEISREIGNKEARAVINQWSGFHILNSISVAVFLLLVGRGAITGTVTVGSIVIFYSYFERLTMCAQNILSNCQDIIEAKNGIARMMPILWQSEKKDGRYLFPADWRMIELNNNLHYLLLLHIIIKRSPILMGILL